MLLTGLQLEEPDYLEVSLGKYSKYVRLHVVLFHFRLNLGLVLLCFVLFFLF